MSISRPILLLSLCALLLGACSPSQPGPGIGPDGTLTLSGQLMTQGQTVKVTVLGLPPVTTDAQGNFKIAGVKVPYTLRADFPQAGSPGQTQALILEDLTSSDLTPLKTFVRLQTPTQQPPNPPAPAVLKGALIGDLDFFRDAKLYLTSVTSSASYGTVLKNTRIFEVPVRSNDAPPSGPGTLHALQSDGDYTSLVQTYTRYGETHLTLPGAGVLEGQNIVLAPITTARLNLKIGALVGAQPQARIYTGFRTSKSEGGVSLGRGSAPLETSVSLPNIAGAEYSLSVNLDEVSSGPLYRNSAASRLLDALPTTLEVNPPPFLDWVSPDFSQPIDASSNDYLSWGPGSGLTVLNFDESVSTNGDRRHLFTAILQKNRFSLKDYSFALQAGHTYYVQLTRLGGLSYTRALSLFDYDTLGSQTWLLGGADVQSLQLTFKTQP